MTNVYVEMPAGNMHLRNGEDGPIYPAVLTGRSSGNYLHAVINVPGNYKHPGRYQFIQWVHIDSVLLPHQVEAT